MKLHFKHRVLHKLHIISHKAKKKSKYLEIQFSTKGKKGFFPPSFKKKKEVRKIYLLSRNVTWLLVSCLVKRSLNWITLAPQVQNSPCFMRDVLWQYEYVMQNQIIWQVLKKEIFFFYENYSSSEIVFCWKKMVAVQFLPLVPFHLYFELNLFFLLLNAKNFFFVIFENIDNQVRQEMNYDV